MNDGLTTDPAYTGDASVPGPRAEVEVSSPGNWPRMIHFGQDVEDRLIQYIDHEIELFGLERGPLLEDWKNYQTLYWAKPEKKQRNFPFTKAANIVVPLAAIAVEAIHARTMNTLFSVEPFWSIRAKSKPWIESAKPVERWLQSEVESSDTLDMYNFCNNTLLELFKLGTGVAKVGYERRVKKSLRNVGGTEEEFFAVTKNGASVHRVPLANFIMRLSENDPQEAPLVGERHDFTWGQLKKMAASGRLDPDAVESIKAWSETLRHGGEIGSGQDLEAHKEMLANAEPLWTDNFEIHELWISFDVDNDGWDEEIVVDYHKPSRTFLSARYNWYDDLHRPYHVGNYQKVEGIWIGIGVCKQVEQFQAEVTTIHRQRLDNATLANMAQIVLKKGSGYGPGEPIFPGKMWFVGDPTKDIKEFKLSEVYPSSYNNEQIVVSYYEKLTGVNEIILGTPQQGTPATATSDLTRLAESNKRFDLVLKNIKRWLSNVGVDVITNYQIFGDQEVHWLTEGEDGVFVEQVLNMPSVLVRRGAIIDLTVTDSITNRETEKQQWLQLFSVLTNYYNQVLQLAQVLGDPNLFMQIGQSALAASDEAVRRLLETFSEPDTDRFTLAGKPEPDNAGPIPTNNFPPGVSPNRIPGLLGSGSASGFGGSNGSAGMGGP